MKHFIFFVISTFICFNILAQSTDNQIIETNLTDNLKTRIRIKKSSNIDFNRLSRLSRITDMHKRRRLRLNNPMNVTSMAISEVLDSNPIYANDSIYALTKRGILNPLYSTNLYVNSLKPLAYLSISHKLFPIEFKTYKLSNSKLSNLNISALNISTISINNMMLGINITDSSNVNSLNALPLRITKLDVDPVEMYDMTVFNDYDGKNMYTDQSIYVIDNSKFNAIITEEILAELARDTSIYSYEKSREFNIAYYKDLQALDRDKYYEWIKFLGQHYSSDIEFIQNNHRFKIIGEARIENDKYTDDQKQCLKSNLEILKSEGYDTVLIRFYCDQDINLITNMICDIKSTGMNVFSVYVGLDNRKPQPWNPYVEPALIEKYISQIAPLSDGWMLNWRSTSQHVKLLPKEFYNYICKTVRKYNKTCLIYGEIYYGQIDPLRINALMYNIPENVTGVLINNMGFYGYNHSFIINKMFTNVVPNYKKLDKIAQVIGYRPYYSSKNNLYLDVNDEYNYKHKIENNFRKVRCGTITMLHDGVDDNYTEDIITWQTQDNIMYDFKIKNLNKGNK